MPNALEEAAHRAAARIDEEANRREMGLRLVGRGGDVNVRQAFHPGEVLDNAAGGARQFIWKHPVKQEEVDGDDVVYLEGAEVIMDEVEGDLVRKNRMAKPKLELHETLFKGKLVYIVGNDAQVEAMFKMAGARTLCINAPTKTAEYLEKPDVVIFTGGSDVSPILYGEVNKASNCDINRDVTEMLWYRWFEDVPKLGICRGGQFLNVMNGGKMLQDIPNHGLEGEHSLRFHHWFNGKDEMVTSTHHQAMVHNGNATVIATGPNNINEVIIYSRTKSLCFQPHPEYGVGSTRRIFFFMLAQTGWF